MFKIDTSEIFISEPQELKFIEIAEILNLDIDCSNEIKLDFKKNEDEIVIKEIELK